MVYGTFAPSSLMLTWFISTKKIARPRSKSTPSSRLQLRFRFAGSKGMFHDLSGIEPAHRKICDVVILFLSGSPSPSHLYWQLSSSGFREAHRSFALHSHEFSTTCCPSFY